MHGLLCLMPSIILTSILVHARHVEMAVQEHSRRLFQSSLFNDDFYLLCVPYIMQLKRRSSDFNT